MRFSNDSESKDKCILKIPRPTHGDSSHFYACAQELLSTTTDVEHRPFSFMPNGSIFFWCAGCTVHTMMPSRCNNLTLGQNPHAIGFTTQCYSGKLPNASSLLHSATKRTRESLAVCSNISCLHSPKLSDLID